MKKNDRDIAEEYGCVCCGSGYIKVIDGVVKYFSKAESIIDYMKSIGKSKIKKNDSRK